MITKYRGIPIYGVPLDELDVSMIIELERYIEIMWHGHEVHIVSQMDNYLMMAKVLAFRDKDDSPFFTCYLKHVHCCLQSEAKDAFRILGDVIGQSYSTLSSPEPPKAPKPPLGKLRKIPTCECCGGELDFETLTCKYCGAKYYVEEDTNEEDIYITTDARNGGVGYTSNPSRYNQRRREDLGRRLYSGFIPDWS